MTPGANPESRSRFTTDSVRFVVNCDRCNRRGMRVFQKAVVASPWDPELMMMVCLLLLSVIMEFG